MILSIILVTRLLPSYHPLVSHGLFLSSCRFHENMYKHEGVHISQKSKVNQPYQAHQPWQSNSLLHVGSCWLVLGSCWHQGVSSLARGICCFFLPADGSHSVHLLDRHGPVLLLFLLGFLEGPGVVRGLEPADKALDLWVGVGEGCRPPCIQAFPRGETS